MQLCSTNRKVELCKRNRVMDVNLSNPQVLQSTTSYGVSDNYSYLTLVKNQISFTKHYLVYYKVTATIQLKLIRIPSTQIFQQYVFCILFAAPWLQQTGQYQLITFIYSVTVKSKKNEVSQWFHLTALQSSKCKCIYTAHRTKFQPDWKWCMLWHSTQNSPKCHTPLQYTRTRAHLTSFMLIRKVKPSMNQVLHNSYMLNSVTCISLTQFHQNRTIHV